MTYTIHINNKVASVKAGTTILEACESLGVKIPRFCYYKRLSVSGNCRMCLVEIEKSLKPIVSCAMPIVNEMRIHTDTPMVKKAREGILEFLLLNHPLDCPVCDQGGECDLQEQTLKFGADKSRFYDFKRGVENKNLGPLIKTIMNRCIHCTRCVRFSLEVGGVQYLGTTTRGIKTEIGTYLQKVFRSELSGNVIDLCPVGALTSKPYTFTSRPWELKTVRSIDISDGLGSGIRIDLKENEIMRVLPKLNESNDVDWISDKTRFSHDGLQLQRLRHPTIRSRINIITMEKQLSFKEFTSFLRSENNSTPYLDCAYQDFEFELNKSLHTTWKSSVQKVCELILDLSDKDITGIFGSITDLETQLSFREFINSLGSENIGSLNKLHINLDFSTKYRLNTTITRISDADLCLLVGVNPRYEGSLLNVRLRKRYLTGELEVASIGPSFNLTYTFDHLGLGGPTLIQISKGKHPFCSKLKKAKKPVFILGLGVLGRNDSNGIQALLNSINIETATSTSSWKGLGVLHANSNQVGALDLGLNYINPSELRFTILAHSFYNRPQRILYLVNVSQQEWSEFIKELFFRNSWNYKLKKKFKNQLYIKFRAETWLISHKSYVELGDDADITFPNVVPSEKVATFINTEGRPQISNKVVFPRGKIREDWSIFRALSEKIGNSMKYNTLKDLKKRTAILLPSINSMNKVEKNEVCKIEKKVKSHKIYATKFIPLIEDFYLTDLLTRTSKVMAECSSFLRKESTNFQ
jgi:NADH dehydrogenase/NADH:ubiquinone oxidoreductase subunit G